MSMTSPEAIHEARIAQRLTVRELAARAGVAPNSVTKAEHGRPLSPMALAKIVDALALTHSGDTGPNGYTSARTSPTVTGASQVVLDIPEGELGDLTPTELSMLKMEAQLAWLRARQGMRRA